MARNSRPAATFTVTIAQPMRIDNGTPTGFKAVLISEPLTAAQIAAALVGGANCRCETCGDCWDQCPPLRKAVEAVLPATRAEYVAINARHGITVTADA